MRTAVASTPSATEIRTSVRAQSEDRAEEDADARRPVPGARVRREDREEEDAEAERPGEERADDDVVGAGAVAERAHRDAAADGGDEEAGADVDAERGGGERPGERDVAERVAREDLRAQHDEAADEPACEPDEAAGDERVAHELLREHQARIRATRYAANESDVT